MARPLHHTGNHYLGATAFGGSLIVLTGEIARRSTQRAMSPGSWLSLRAGHVSGCSQPRGRPPLAGAALITVVVRNLLAGAIALKCLMPGLAFDHGHPFQPARGRSLERPLSVCQAMERKPASGKKCSGGGPRSMLRRRAPGAGMGAVARDGTVAPWNPARNPQDY